MTAKKIVPANSDEVKPDNSANGTSTPVEIPEVKDNLNPLLIESEAKVIELQAKVNLLVEHNDELKSENEKLNEMLAGPKLPKGVSVRESLVLGGEMIIKDSEEIIAKLKLIEKYAIKNGRPSMHFVAFQRNLAAFNASFKRMLR